MWKSLPWVLRVISSPTRRWEATREGGLSAGASRGAGSPPETAAPFGVAGPRGDRPSGGRPSGRQALGAAGQVCCQHSAVPVFSPCRGPPRGLCVGLWPLHPHSPSEEGCPVPVPTVSPARLGRQGVSGMPLTGRLPRGPFRVAPPGRLRKDRDGAWAPGVALLLKNSTWKNHSALRAGPGPLFRVVVETFPPAVDTRVPCPRA